MSQEEGNFVMEITYKLGAGVNSLTVVVDGVTTITDLEFLSIGEASDYVNRLLSWRINHQQHPQPTPP